MVKEHVFNNWSSWSGDGMVVQQDYVGWEALTPLLAFFQGAHPHASSKPARSRSFIVVLLLCLLELLLKRIMDGWAEAATHRHGCPLTTGLAYMDWSSSSPEQIWGDSERWGSIYSRSSAGGTRIMAIVYATHRADQKHPSGYNGVISYVAFVP